MHGVLIATLECDNFAPNIVASRSCACLAKDPKTVVLAFIARSGSGGSQSCHYYNFTIVDAKTSLRAL